MQCYFVLVSVLGIAVRQTSTLQSVPRYLQYPPGNLRNHHNTVDYTSYAVLYIPGTVLYPSICSSLTLHLSPGPQPPAPLCAYESVSALHNTGSRRSKVCLSVVGRVTTGV